MPNPVAQIATDAGAAAKGIVGELKKQAGEATLGTAAQIAQEASFGAITGEPEATTAFPDISEDPEVQQKRAASERAKRVRLQAVQGELEAFVQQKRREQQQQTAAQEQQQAQVARHQEAVQKKKQASWLTRLTASKGTGEMGRTKG